ncbi:MAG TPA: TIGR02285 family protein [Rhodocyclaceae bacterium]
MVRLNACLRILAGLCLSLPPLHAGAQGLTWAVLEFPPFQILEGPHRGSGSFDGELQTLIARLPEFEHRIVPMSFARRREEFTAGIDICTPGIFKAPAMALKLAISKPMLTHLDNRVIFLKEKEGRFGDSAPLDLDALLQDARLVGAVVPGRSYAPNIDASIQRARGRPNLLIRPLETGQLFRMLLGGDVDYLLLFPHEAAFLAEKFAATGRIANRPIAGTPPYIFTHVACTGDDWGRAVIARIDAAMAAERGKPEYRGYSERWYPPEDQERVRRYYTEMLKEH